MNPLPPSLDFYSNYKHFTEQVLDAVRKETFGVDIGQNSWTTVEEYDRFIEWLGIGFGSRVLEVASGSGGPAIHLANKTGCHVTGIDANAGAIDTATTLAEAVKQGDKVRFTLADANSRLPFDANTFDGLLCIDAMNHLPDRLAVLKEWHRVLRPGKHAVFTDPVVIMGPVTNEELALRSSVGLFLFVPFGLNEQLIGEAGLKVIHQDDVTANASLIASRWHKARQDHKNDLLGIEGEERFEGSQRFFEAVYKLTNERRLARIVYVVEKTTEHA